MIQPPEYDASTASLPHYDANGGASTWGDTGPASHGSSLFHNSEENEDAYEEALAYEGAARRALAEAAATLKNSSESAALRALPEETSVQMGAMGYFLSPFARGHPEVKQDFQFGGIISPPEVQRVGMEPFTLKAAGAPTFILPAGGVAGGENGGGAAGRRSGGMNGHLAAFREEFGGVPVEEGGGAVWGCGGGLRGDGGTADAASTVLPLSFYDANPFGEGMSMPTGFLSAFQALPPGADASQLRRAVLKSNRKADRGEEASAEKEGRRCQQGRCQRKPTTEVIAVSTDGGEAAGVMINHEDDDSYSAWILSLLGTFPRKAGGTTLSPVREGEAAAASGARKKKSLPCC